MVKKENKKKVKQDQLVEEIITSENLDKFVSIETTKEVKVPEKLVDQIIGQDFAVEVIKKAALQRRHVLLIGEPGTGKSMLGKALAELLPVEKLKDILAFSNPLDENNPLIRTVDAGKGREIVEKAKFEDLKSRGGQNLFMFILILISLILPWWFRTQYGDIVFAATFIGGMMFVMAMAMSLSMVKRNSAVLIPKLLVDNKDKKQAPFYDATGAHAGALLGDVLHDPFQSGGLGTPAHERVVAGLIHKAHKGVLFIDEISTLSLRTQQELLTALQEKEFPITGQSERSAGAMVRTEPVPCDFILVAAGNLETIKQMHPALRSRIIGYGYEVYMNETMPATKENVEKMVRFVAQEVQRDGKIPHFKREAVIEIIKEAMRLASRKGHITLRLRELGGLIRSAGDIALEKGHEFVLKEDVIDALKIARPLEKQISDEFIERKKEYQVILNQGSEIGRVNGLAVIGVGTRMSGLVLPIEAIVVDGENGNKFVATGQLGKIAKEAVINISALIKKAYGVDLNKKDVYIQFLQTYEGVEGDSASIAIAIAVLSAITKIPIRQDVAITGSLSVRGNVLPVGGVTYKIEGAIESGMKKVIIPKSNLGDVVITHVDKNKIDIVTVNHLVDVFEHVFDYEKNPKAFKQMIEKFKKIE
ncbi:MAG: ATP-dependent protease LonB [Candidatus Woesearchaeota archaeon]